MPDNATAAPAPDAATDAATTPPSAGTVSAGTTVAEQADDTRSLVEDDIAPTIRVFQSEAAEILLGGLVQMHFAPYVGSDSLLANDDTATREGFRLRRARVGMEGHFRHGVELLLSINPLESDSEVGTVSDARITVSPMPWVRVAVGTTKVPYSRAGLASSRSLTTIERPLAVREMSPERRLGLTAEGEVLGRKLSYLVAFLNATEGYDLGNRFGGFLYGARVQYAVLGMPDPRDPEAFGLSVGAAGLYEDGPAITRVATTADVFLAIQRSSLEIGVLLDRQEPVDAPVNSPMLSDQIDRLGAYAEIGYTLPRWSLQPIVRAELFDDDRDFDDAGDAILVSAGCNARPYPNTRIQLHYQARRERYSGARSNDSVVFNLQGEF